MRYLATGVASRYVGRTIAGNVGYPCSLFRLAALHYLRQFWEAQ